MKMFVGRIVAFCAKGAIDSMDALEARIEKVWGDPVVGADRCATAALTVEVPEKGRERHEAVPIFPSRQAAAHVIGKIDCAFLLG